jgi:hypothetical protein
MALIKHIVDENGVGQDVPMTPEEEADFLASLPVRVEPVPASITRRQCAKQMLAMGLIKADEALAMTRNGTPPSMVAAMFAQMPADQAVMAEIDFAADTYVRSNPLLVSLMTATGASSADIDQFFRDAAAL